MPECNNEMHPRKGARVQGVWCSYLLCASEIAVNANGDSPSPQPHPLTPSPKGEGEACGVIKCHALKELVRFCASKRYFSFFFALKRKKVGK